MGDISYGVGGPRIRTLSATGATEATLQLPAPDQGGITYTPDPAALLVDEMLDYSLNVTVHGYYHVWKIKWSVYDHSSTGLVTGTANGQTPNVLQLTQILSQYRPGRLLFSPGPTGDFYSVYVSKMPTITPISDLATSYEVELKTTSVHPSIDGSAAKSLGA